MKTLIWTLFVLTLFVLSGCVTQKRCYERFPCYQGRDSVYIETLDTVQIIIPGDSIMITTEVPCDDFELKAENSQLLASLKVVNGILWAKMKEKPDTIYKFTTNTVTKTQYIPKTVEVRFVPKFWKIAGWIGVGSVILFLVFLLLRFRKLIRG